MKKKLLKMHYKQKITPFLNKSLLLSLGCLFTFNLVLAQDESEPVAVPAAAVVVVTDSTAVVVEESKKYNCFRFY